MKKNVTEKVITFEEALEMPEYTHLHEVIRYLEKTPPEGLFPKKYLASLTRCVDEMVYKLYIENPSMPLRDVITHVLNRLSANLSAKLLLKMTQLTIEKWGKYSANPYFNKKISQLA
jgi:hypothetical protein